MGDASLDGVVDMSDAALVQSRLYGSVAASAVSPLALADGDATLDLGDMLYAAQIASGARTGVGPAPALLTITPPAPATYVSGVAPNPVLNFAVASNYPDATLVDGLDALGWSISSALSTLVNSDMSVIGSMADTELVANNPGPGNDVFDVGLTIDVADSDGALAQQAAASQTFTVTPVGFCASQPDGTPCGGVPMACHLQDTCVGGVCVNNGFSTAGTNCGTGPGTPPTCKTQDTCNGTGTCNMGVAPAGTVCRADADGPPPVGGCDAEEICDGVATTCPADICQPTGAACDDGINEPDADACDPTCVCGYEPMCAAFSVTLGWKTPAGTSIADITNLGAGDVICRDFTGGVYPGGSTCTVNGVNVSCTNPSGSRLCIPAASLTANLFDPTLANCSALTTAASRLRNVVIGCGTATTGNVPATYAMRVVDGLGGPGNGFSNGSIQVCALDRWTGAGIGQAVGIQVEDPDTSPPTILHRATIASGNTCTTISGAGLTGKLTVTGASEGYQIFTVSKADSREFELVMTKRAGRELAETPASSTWYLYGDFLATSYDQVYTVASRHGGCNGNLSPNPVRGGLAIASLYRTSFTNLSLEALLAPSVYKHLRICGNALNMGTGLPGNLASPDIMGNNAGAYGQADITRFENIKVTRTNNVMIQALGAGLSPEALSVAALTGGADLSITIFDLMMAGQEMASVNPGTQCPAGGGPCNVNPRAANGASFNIGHMPGYTHGLANRWEFWKWNWNHVNGVDVNVMTQFEQAGVFFGHDPDSTNGTGGAVGPANTVATDPADNDFIRYGPTATFGCSNGAANCYNDVGGSRAWRGFIGRDVNVQGGATKAEQLNVYGMFIDGGILEDNLIALNIYLGARVTNAGATSIAAIGGPIHSQAVSYINAELPGAITSARTGTINAWFKFEARASVKITETPDAAVTATCSLTNLAPRAGNCIEAGWDDDNLVGIPTAVQDGLGLAPYDMGSGASVNQCVASIAPGELCLGMGSGDVRTLGLGSRTFAFDNNSAGLAQPWGDPDLIAHVLGVNGGQAFYAGALATATSTECVGGTRDGEACLRYPGLENSDCRADGNPGAIDGVCTVTTNAVSSADDAWMIVGQGPGMAAGAAQGFVLPDLRLACPSCTPSTALTVKDWRHLNNGATPGGFTDGGPGFSSLELDNCTAAGCKTAARGRCLGGTNPGVACVADGTCTGGGVCGQPYSEMTWTMYGYGSASMNSCQTANAWHYRELDLGQTGGIEEALFFSANTMTSIFNY